MKTQKRYSPEVQERAVRMVLEQQNGHTSQWAAIQSISSKIGCTHGILRTASAFYAQVEIERKLK